MGKSRLKGKDLRKINYRSNQAISVAIDVMQKHGKHWSKQEKLDLLSDVLLHPEKYLDHAFLDAVAHCFVEVLEQENFTKYQLTAPKPVQVFGKKFIDQNTLNQMDVVSQLPIAVQGALMPDAHVGYGLPIGGVLATKNEVVPYAIGLDIACRMSLTIFDDAVTEMSRRSHQFKMALKEHTHFGIGNQQDESTDHFVFDDERFQATEVLRTLKGKAMKQIGTSGSGNHFVEFGEVVLEENNQLNLPAGHYLGLLSHSGSRGFGAAIANYYTRVAIDQCKLPTGAQHLAWLDLNSEAGQEYWLSMELAGDYAKACHDVIHQKLTKSLGLKALVNVENHHNFAWKERLNGEELIVHRKGATPAQEGVLGIIPGSMMHPGYIVSGKGNPLSINSAAHGAGRKMSRKKAKESLTGSEMKKQLKANKITLIGGGVDESPMVYKNIEEVMKGQKELVEVQGKFFPRIVRMDKK